MNDQDVKDVRTLIEFIYAAPSIIGDIDPAWLLEKLDKLAEGKSPLRVLQEIPEREVHPKQKKFLEDLARKYASWTKWSCKTCGYRIDFPPNGIPGTPKCPNESSPLSRLWV